MFKKAYAAFNPQEVVCPHCHAHKLEIHSQYTRGLISSTGKCIVAIRRYLCLICEKTHAILPDIIIPYGRYSLHFRLQAVHAYYTRRVSVENLCADLGIALSTLYRWLKRFQRHKAIFLGCLKDPLTSCAEFVRFFLDSSALSVILHQFFRQFGLSFWQAKTTCPYPRPPDAVVTR